MNLPVPKQDHRVSGSYPLTNSANKEARRGRRCKHPLLPRSLSGGKQFVRHGLVPMPSSVKTFSQH